MNRQDKRQALTKKQKSEEKEKEGILNVQHEQKRGEKQWVEKLQHKGKNMDDASLLEIEQPKRPVLELSMELEEQRNKIQNIKLFQQWHNEVTKLSEEADQLQGENSMLHKRLEKERNETAVLKSCLGIRKGGEFKQYTLPDESNSKPSVHHNCDADSQCRELWLGSSPQEILVLEDVKSFEIKLDEKYKILCAEAFVRRHHLETVALAMKELCECLIRDGHYSKLRHVSVPKAIKIICDLCEDDNHLGYNENDEAYQRIKTYLRHDELEEAFDRIRGYLQCCFPRASFSEPLSEESKKWIFDMIKTHYNKDMERAKEVLMKFDRYV